MFMLCDGTTADSRWEPEDLCFVAVDLCWETEDSCCVAVDVEKKMKLHVVRRQIHVVWPKIYVGEKKMKLHVMRRQIHVGNLKIHVV